MNRLTILTTPLALIAALILGTTPILGSTSPAFAANKCSATSTTTEVHDRIIPPFFCYTMLVFIAGTST